MPTNTPRGQIPEPTGSEVVTRAAINAALTQIDTVGMFRIGEIVLAAPAATLDFSSIPAVFRHLFLDLAGSTTGADTSLDDLLIQFNADATSGHYRAPLVTLSSGTPGAQTNWCGSMSGNTSHRADLYTSQRIVLRNYRQTDVNKVIDFHAQQDYGTGAVVVRYDGFGEWLSAAAINRITLLLGTGPTFQIGTVATLYGI